MTLVAQVDRDDFEMGVVALCGCDAIFKVPISATNPPTGAFMHSLLHSCCRTIDSRV